MPQDPSEDGLAASYCVPDSGQAVIIFSLDSSDDPQ